MAKYRELTYKNSPGVLRRLADLIEDDLKHNPENADGAGWEEFVEAIDGQLDELASQDFFGTEGQLDPRGDQRTKR